VNASVPNPGVAAVGTEAPTTEAVDALYFAPTLRAPKARNFSWNVMLRRLLAGLSRTPSA
jgi:hypothetical protein